MKNNENCVEIKDSFNGSDEDADGDDHHCEHYNNNGFDYVVLSIAKI